MPRSAPANVLLLHGEEPFLIEEAARRTLEEWKKDLVSDFGFDPIDPGGLNAERLRDAIVQLPFLDPYRIVAVRSIVARRADGLAPALAEVPETTRVLLTVNGKLAATSRLVKAVTAAKGMARDHPTPRARALQDWIRDRAREYGLPVNVGATVGRLVRPDVGVIDAELRKLAGYQATGNRLDQETVRELVVSDRPEQIFRLTDHLLPRPTGEAWRVALDLLQREQPTSIAYRLARHLSLVLSVRAHQERGEDLATVQAAMREHPFVVQKAYDAARQTTAQRLELGLRVLLDYEWEVKSGQIDAEWGLQGVLARL
ncbi:MAG TPA: DNA polymerase III subunit delta [Candidatus Dormibacteraeota bacterium]|jgi:DNA polymerase-3 subunit delta|nr:DNA polymerase III subunit delta [Candidatus Dormibacteraeota bacterium]